MTEPLFVVHVIESPSSLDLLDGQEEGTTLQSALGLMGVSCELYRTVSRAMLDEAVRRIEALHAPGGEYATHRPIVHLSCHGNETGIRLTSGDHLGWMELGSTIAPINLVASEMLVVGMSTCQGYQAIAMARTLERVPYGLLVGPTHDVQWRDSLVAFITLYHRMTKEFPDTSEKFSQILDAVNDATGLERGTFTSASAATVQADFRSAVIDFLRNDARLKLKEGGILAQLFAEPKPPA